MTARLYASQFFYLAMVLVSFYTYSVEAATRAVMIPGRTAILLMEGFSSAGEDPDPRRLYDSIAMTPVQQSGGEGKVMKTRAKEFNFTCATKNSQANSIVCNIVVNASATSQIDLQHAVFHIEGADAQMLNEKFAGGHGVFQFESTDRRMKIQSTRERFDFDFHQ